MVFFDEKIAVPVRVRTTTITLQNKDHHAINEMTSAAKGSWWRRMSEAIQQKCGTCIPFHKILKNLRHNLPCNESKQSLKHSELKGDKHLDFDGSITERDRGFYTLPFVDRQSKFAKKPDNNSAVQFLKKYITLNKIAKRMKADRVTALTSRKVEKISLV